MSMDKVKAIVAAAGVGYLATTDGKRPGVRPMGSLRWVDGELWCACAVNSDKVNDIRQNPHVEFYVADKDWQSVRIAGACTVSTDAADRQKFLDLVPEVKGYFTGADDPNYAVLRTKLDRVRLWAMGAAGPGEEVEID